jgi:hypothetical protein
MDFLRNREWLKMSKVYLSFFGLKNNYKKSWGIRKNVGNVKNM